MSEQTPERPHTMGGVPYWVNHVTAVIDVVADAERAVQALYVAGRSAEDARYWTGDAVLKNHEAFMAHRGVVQRIVDVVFSNEWANAEEYLVEMRKGHTFVEVAVSDAASTHEAGRILREYGAHLMRHYSRTTITDLD